MPRCNYLPNRIFINRFSHLSDTRFLADGGEWHTFAHVIKVHHRFEQFIINQTTDTEKIILLICVICGEKLKTKTMIDYSVYLTGNPMDEMAPEKAYARAQMSESMTFDKFVKHIADHNGVYTRGTVQGVILDMCECLVEMLLEGKKVQLGALGDFFISLNSVGAESLKAFTAANIKSINVVFTPGADFDGLLEKAKFNPP